MNLETKINNLIEESLKLDGYEVVRVLVSGGRRKTVQIMAEKADGGNITLSDCEKISRTASALLDVNDVMKDSFDLEVSSPGIDRPLMRLKDFARFEGYDAKIETGIPINGQRRFTGVLRGVTGSTIKLGDTEIDFDNIERAKLILTDNLIKGVKS